MLMAKLPKLTNHVTAEGAEREEIFEDRLPRLTVYSTRRKGEEAQRQKKKTS